MSPRRNNRFFLAAALLPFLSCVAHAGQTHVHGAARAAVAIDGPMLQIELLGPLDSMIGFEHAPRTAEQQRAIDQMMRALRQPERLFAVTDAARCTPDPVAVSSPFAAGKSHHPGSDGAVHADLEATFTFRCLAPAALKSIEFNLFDAFPRMRKVEVELAGPKGQAATTLTPKRRLLSW